MGGEADIDHSPSDDIENRANSVTEGILTSLDNNTVSATAFTPRPRVPSPPQSPPIYSKPVRNQETTQNTGLDDTSNSVPEGILVSLDDITVSATASTPRPRVLSPPQSLPINSRPVVSQELSDNTTLNDTSNSVTEGIFFSFDDSETAANSDLISLNENMENELLVSSQAQASATNDQDVYGALWGDTGAAASTNGDSSFSLPPPPPLNRNANDRSPGSAASGGVVRPERGARRSVGQTPERPRLQAENNIYSFGNSAPTPGSTASTPGSPMSPPSYTAQAPVTPVRCVPPFDIPVSPISPLMPPFYTPSDSLLGASGFRRPVSGATDLPAPVVSNEPAPTNLLVLSPKMLEAIGTDDNDAPQVGGWNAPPGEEGAPPPYMARGLLSRGAQTSLKKSQVELLRKEVAHAGGVKVILRRIDCHHTLALVECFNGVW